MKFLLIQTKHFLTNRTGLSCVFANLFLIVWGVFFIGDDFHTFHLTYEPLPIKIVILLNIPAMIAAGIIEALFFPSPQRMQSTLIEISNLTIVLNSICSIFQWLTIGYFCELVFRKKLK